VSAHERSLDALAALLKRKARTAREIAAVTGCSKPTAYARIAALQARGDRVFEVTEREQRPGPASRAFGIR
jgi:DNA-binding IclR family transcriptional regulator